MDDAKTYNGFSNFAQVYTDSQGQCVWRLTTPQMSDSILPTDSDLLAEFARSGSERPFEMLVRRHGALVLSVCRGILRDANDAEDAAQAAFLTLARKARSLVGHRTIAGWLHTVAWHISCRARRARTLRQHREREAAAA